MDYDQFDTEYRRVSEAARAGASETVLAAELTRLRTLVAAITDTADRADAEHDVAALADVLAHDDEPASPAAVEAARIHAAATAATGTPAERIARLEAAMQQIGQIAAGADPAEQSAIRALNEPLALLIDALR